VKRKKKEMNKIQIDGYSSGGESFRSFKATVENLLLNHVAYAIFGFPSEEMAIKSVASFIDYFLHEISSDNRMRQLSESEIANRLICHASVNMSEKQYSTAETDIREITLIGGALAMSILSMIQNEIIFDT
jgi:hypothetical protein